MIGEDIKISVIFKDKNILAVDKPSGLSVHNIEDSQNLLNILESQISIDKLYLLHRLDKETSGVQLLALNQESAQKYSQEFQEKTVKKTYVGILRGNFNESEGHWTWDLTDKAEGHRNPKGITSARVPCDTGFRVLHRSKYFTSCQFDLITGRQHQIRKHAALSGHSLIGDQRYGEKTYNKKIFSLYGVDRMFLHCAKIEISKMVFESLVPGEFDKLF